MACSLPLLLVSSSRLLEVSAGIPAGHPSLLQDVLLLIKPRFPPLLPAALMVEVCCCLGSALQEAGSSATVGCLLVT